VKEKQVRDRQLQKTHDCPTGADRNSIVQKRS